jgi:hypothetical protein
MAGINFWGRIMAGVTAFKDAYLNAGAKDTGVFDSFDARQMRYEINWALLENSVYNKINKWAHTLKIERGLYEATRGIYNPTARIIDAWQTFIWGGILDLAAGDGNDKPSALPIFIPDANAKADDLRAAISALWLASSWQIRKDAFTMRTATFGDGALLVVDDTERGRMYLKTIHPGTIRDITLDDFGNVKGYVIEEWRDDPKTERLRVGAQMNQVPNQVLYTERASRDGNLVVYETYLNNAPYAWNTDQGAKWEEGYGFVPLVMCQHNNVGGNWGWSEIHSAFAKFFEVDDLSSKLHDQIRIIVHSKWFLAGVDKPSTTPTIRAETSSSSTDVDIKRRQRREEEPFVYAPQGSTATPMVAPLQIADASAEIKQTLEGLESDFPELKDDIWTAGGDASGKALAVARQRVETRVDKRRPNYDNALVRAQQMAIAIGGYRGYKGYEEFDLNSFDAGELNHSIGDRPIFRPLPQDKIEHGNLIFTGAQAAVTTGSMIDAGTASALLEKYLRTYGGMTDEDLKEIGQMRAAGILNAQEDAVLVGADGEAVEQ